MSKKFETIIRKELRDYVYPDLSWTNVYAAIQHDDMREVSDYIEKLVSNTEEEKSHIDGITFRRMSDWSYHVHGMDDQQREDYIVIYHAETRARS